MTIKLSQLKIAQLQSKNKRTLKNIYFQEVIDCQINFFYLDHCVIFRRMVTRDTCFCFVNRFPINIIYLLTLGLCTTYYPMQTKRLSSTSLKGVKAAPSFDDKKQQNCHLMSIEYLYLKSYCNSHNLYSFKGLINMFTKRLSKTHS